MNCTYFDECHSTGRPTADGLTLCDYHRSRAKLIYAQLRAEPWYRARAAEVAQQARRRKTK